MVLPGRLTLIACPIGMRRRNGWFGGDGVVDADAVEAAHGVTHADWGTVRVWCAPEAGALAVAAGFGFQEVVVAAALAECDYGSWADRSLDEVSHQQGDGLGRWLTDPDARPHGGETLREHVSRVGAWLDGQVAAPGRAVAVTHASVVRAAVAHVLGAPPLSTQRVDIVPLSTTAFSSDGRRWVVRPGREIRADRSGGPVRGR